MIGLIILSIGVMLLTYLAIENENLQNNNKY